VSVTRIRFDNGRGHQLAGLLDLPDGAVRAWAVFAHCFTCTKNLRAIRQIVGPLSDAGIGILRFDFTGLGASQGDFADENFSRNIGDLVAAAGHLEQHYAPPALLIGHSLGGTACLHAAARIPSVRAVATIGSPAHPEHVAALLRSSLAEIEATGEAEVNLGGRTFRIRKQFLDDLASSPTLDRVRQLRRALLVMHAPSDTVVGIGNAGDIFQAALHPKSFVSLDSADHLLSQERDAAYAGKVLAAWATRYLPVATAQSPAPAAREVTT
jgi:putative redox protein